MDDASTLKLGELSYENCRQTLERVITTTCRALIDLYQETAIVTELSGCLSDQPQETEPEGMGRGAV